MSFSYSGDPSTSDLDRVRFETADTSPPGILQDEEINYLLNNSSSVEVAIVKASEDILNRLALCPDSEKVDKVQINNQGLYNRYKQISDDLRNKYSAPCPYMGGLSKEERRADDENDDLIQMQVDPYAYKNDKTEDCEGHRS